MAKYPISWAVVVALLIGYLFYYMQFAVFADQITPVVHPVEIPRFMLVWGWHIGLYLGALMGIIHSAVTIRRNVRMPPA